MREVSLEKTKRIKSSKRPKAFIVKLRNCCVMLPNQLSKAKAGEILFEALKMLTVGMLLGLRTHKKVKRNLREENTTKVNFARSVTDCRS